jgi:hypothetical protein
MSFHFPKLENSKDLQSLLAFLKGQGKQGATSLEIFRACGMLNPGREVSALRKNGMRIGCKYEHKNDHGKKIYRYRYESAETALAAPAARFQTSTALPTVQQAVPEETSIQGLLALDKVGGVR